MTQTILCHGCFDLLHVGHIKHLQEARKLGDRLVVSITDDKYVDKGLGRPRFTAEQRAAAIKALSCVDEVVINSSQSAVEVISRIKPAIYVKGIDYKGSNDARLDLERMAVESVGGRLVVTESEKLSSSAILRSEMFSEDVVKYLDHAKKLDFRSAILEAFDEADKLRISFVGETIVDEYRYVQGLGKSSKEMMLAVVEVGCEQFEGGAIAASKHGEWKFSEGISPTEYIKKTRYVDKDFNRKIFDVYSQQRLCLSSVRRRKFQEQLSEVITGSDVVVAMDFGHGLLEVTERDYLEGAKFLAVNSQSNAGNYGFNPVTKYLKPKFICIDDPEARLAAGMQIDPIEAVMLTLQSRSGCDSAIVTHGKFGSRWMGPNGIGLAPAFASGGIDTMGAGDAVMALTAPLVAVGLPVQMAAFVGNIAGAIKTSIVGHRRHVNRQEIIQTVEALLA